MEQHLVRSHLGGYYISNSPIETIEEVCEQCFDNDEVLVSFEENNDKAKYEAISILLCGESIIDEKSLRNALISYGVFYYGIDETNKIVTIPLYEVFLLLNELKNDN